MGDVCVWKVFFEVISWTFFEWEKAVLFNEGSFMTEADENAVKKLHNKIIHISIVLVIFSLFEIFQTHHSCITIPKSKQKEMCTKY